MTTYREVPDFPGYRFGDDGTIWSRRTRGPGDSLRESWRLIVPVLTKAGYFKVGLWSQGRRVHRTVHRFILEAFVGLRPHGLWARHHNGDRLDNRLTNISWDTKPANYADRDEQGTTAKREQHGRAKLTESDVELIRKIRLSGVSQQRIAERFGVSQKQISRIARGLAWA